MDLKHPQVSYSPGPGGLGGGFTGGFHPRDCDLVELNCGPKDSGGDTHLEACIADIQFERQQN